MKTGRARKKGFTLIELMIVVTIIAVLTPVIFRLYHEGLKKSDDQRAEQAAALAGAGILFERMEQDFRHAQRIEGGFAGVNTDEYRLVLKIQPPEERRRLLGTSGDLSESSAGRAELLVVYRLDPSGEVIREVYPGDAPASGTPNARKVLARGVGRMTFVYNSLSPRQATLVRVRVDIDSIHPDAGPVGPLGCVFRVG